MSEEKTQYPAVQADHQLTAFSGPTGFEAALRMANALVCSSMVPEVYRGKENIPNAIVALEMAQRMGASPLAVMQNLHIIEGRPSWSSSFIIGALNSCKRFSPLRFRMEDRGEKSVPYEYWDGPKGQRTKKTGTMKIHDKACIAWAYDRATNDILEGPEASVEMAVREGWYTKNGSKWQTMPDLMIRYRAAAFFGRLYAPDVLMGMHSEEEVMDSGQIDATPERPAPMLIDPASEPGNSVSGSVVTPPPSPPVKSDPTREWGKAPAGRVKRNAQEMEEDKQYEAYVAAGGVPIAVVVEPCTVPDPDPATDTGATDVTGADSTTETDHECVPAPPLVDSSEEGDLW